MRSIRLSLVVYFLLLLFLALGAISWFVYDTSSQTLQDKVASQRDHLEAQAKIRREGVRVALDQRILTRAETVANLASYKISHYESLYPVGALGAVLEPHGYLASYLWLAGGFNPKVASDIFRSRQARIELAEEMIESETEYFQIYDVWGRPRGRSPNLADEDSFTLDQDRRRAADSYKPYYDYVELEPGTKLRRVTLKAQARRFTQISLPPLWAPKGGFRPPPRFFAPTIFVQYASDTGEQDRELQALESRLQSDLANLERESRHALASLRLRLFGVGLVTFAGVVIGGFWLVRHGLAPLDRLSDAVSRVSPKDFRLPVNQAKLPRELQPIARRMSETLEQLKRVFAREKQAAADISHDLRTPLAAILATIDVGLKKPRPAEEYRELLEECRTSAQHMALLVERLLMLAKLDAGADTIRSRSVDVAEVANQCANLVRPLAEARGLQLRVHRKGETVLHTDPDKIREILTNLLHNAIEYNKPNGSIDVSVERANGHVYMEVRDTGIGIPPEARPQIFERFYRGDKSRRTEGPHHGLGLAIVKGYVDLMGGTIGVESTGEGSTFRVEFPTRN
jgi:heavy metal sensor kinase